MYFDQNILQLRHSALRLRLSLFLMVTVIAVGTLGYRFIEAWNWADCFYMTIITVSTVGFGEIHPLSAGGRIFTAGLIIFGVGVIAYGIAGILETIFFKQMIFFTTKYRTQRIISKMKDHTIICGCGKMGAAVLDELQAEGEHNLVIIENDPAKVAALGENKLPIVTGDATLEHILKEAGIRHAKSLVATLDTDADNLFLVLTAREMNENLNIIARSETESNRKKFIQAGADKTVSPYVAGAQRVFNLLIPSGINDLAEALDSDSRVKFAVNRMDIESNDAFTGKTLAQSNLREVVGGLVVAIKQADGNMSFNPSSDTVMNSGDTLYVMKFSEKSI
jgi:voltage-gated potassium channel